MIKLVLALAAAVILLQDAKPDRNPWGGFPDGSYVVLESERTIDAVKKTVREQITVDTGDEMTHSVGKYTEKGEPPIFFERRKHLPGKGVATLGGVVAKPAAEAVDIGGKSIDCEKIEYGYEKDGRKCKAVAWRTKEIKIPYREIQRDGGDLALDTDLVKFEMTATSGDDVETASFKIVERDVKVAVGDQEVACYVEEGRIEVKKGPITIKGTVKRWLSDAVPGRVVRFELKGEMNGKKIERLERVTGMRIAK